jgi:peptidoglycan hydrolase-like protein with peptidoglycan-binding domain
MPVTGDKGEQVRELQRQLAAVGFDPGPVDGVYGPLTRGAVARLQRYCGLAADGIAGPLTMQTLALLLPHRPQPGRRLGPHFAEAEFTCRCCGMVRVNIRLVHMLETLRARLGGRPVIITSGYRCPAHNRAVRGARLSQHLHGNAADIVVAAAATQDEAAAKNVTSKTNPELIVHVPARDGSSYLTPDIVVDAAKTLGFPGVGRYQGFTHVDVRPNGPARWSG